MSRFSGQRVVPFMSKAAKPPARQWQVVWLPTVRSGYKKGAAVTRKGLECLLSPSLPSSRRTFSCFM